MPTSDIRYQGYCPSYLGIRVRVTHTTEYLVRTAGSCHYLFINLTTVAPLSTLSTYTVSRDGPEVEVLPVACGDQRLNSKPLNR